MELQTQTNQRPEPERQQILQIQQLGFDRETSSPGSGLEDHARFVARAGHAALSCGCGPFPYHTQEESLMPIPTRRRAGRAERGNRVRGGARWPLARRRRTWAPELDQILAGDHRNPKNAARDKYRHPKEVLLFFGIQPDMTVVEVWPSAGWWTEILAPAAAGPGQVQRRLVCDRVSKKAPDYLQGVREGIRRDDGRRGPTSTAR